MGRKKKVVGRTWSKRAVALLAGALAVLAFSRGGVAQSPSDISPLTPRDCGRLNREARQAYDEAIKALDRINAIEAVEKFDEASRLAPSVIELHFLTARLAHMRARRVPSEEAKKYYDLAKVALDRVNKSPDLSPLVRRRYETLLRQVTEEDKTLEVRKQLRMTHGQAFRKEYAEERYSQAGEGSDLSNKKRLVPPRGQRGGGAAPGAGLVPRIPGGPPPGPRPAGGGRSADRES